MRNEARRILLDPLGPVATAPGSDTTARGGDTVNIAACRHFRFGVQREPLPDRSI